MFLRSKGRPIDLGFTLTPMTDRLRVAGTVEFGGLAAPVNLQAIDRRMVSSVKRR
jgi:hypothetical protein